MEEIIRKVNLGEKLSFSEAGQLFSAMVTGSCTEAQIASALVAMRFRGETSDELAALVTTLDGHKKTLHHDAAMSIDTCGTGGDGKSTVNVSTAVGFILAAMGYTVVKHGNSAQSGKVGSADILRRLGIDIDGMRDRGDVFLREHNFVFMFAPYFHPALKGIGKVRREIRVPTIFNFAGPLVNPAEPSHQVIGIPDRERLDFIADVLVRVGRGNVTVYSSRDGYDEVSTMDITDCVSVRGGRKERFQIDPADFFTPFPMPVVMNEDEAENIFLSGISGKREDVARLFAINTALALKTMDVYQLDEGYRIAYNVIESGAVRTKLDDIRRGLC